MKTSHLLRKGTLALAIGCGFATPLVLLTPPAFGQSNISGDISGLVTDPTGASVPNAKVTVVSKGTGETKTATTDGSGNYRISLLKPDVYTITITAPGFETTSTQANVTPGTVVNGSTKLTVGQNSQTVEVTETAPLLHTESAELATTFSQQAVQNLPNPGNDLTFVAQTAPGSVMNTQGGYGNFASFGLPATSNTFTVNGGYENDPFLNLNNSGASNLLLGNNDVSEVNVVSNAYGSQYGGLGGAQVNEISRSGANTFHGNATYYFNGAFLNANDFFNNQTGTPRGQVHANQWSAAIGGPVIRDKTFFFINTEGLRVLIPSNTQVFAPSPAFQAATIAANPNSASFYQKLFSAYTSSPNYAGAVADQGDPNAVTYTGSTTNLAREWIVTGRVDQKLGPNDNMFAHFYIDHGVQPTHSDPVNTIFNADSPQPSYQGQLNETHSFSPNITNQFIFGELWYKAVFTNTNQAAANAISPFTLFFTSGDLANTGLGGLDYVWPQGRDVEGYQFIDDLSINHGNHVIKLGWSIRRDDITDYGPGVLTTPLVETSEADFQAGIGDFYLQQFPQRPTQPVTAYNMGAYIQDQWKMLPNLTVTAGMRLEHNSDFTCLTNCFANVSSAFSSLPTSTTTPYNQLIDAGRHRAFLSFQHVVYEPRVGFAYLPFGPDSHTTVRGGFGMFADAFPGQLADSLLNNAPTNVGFAVGGGALDPSIAGSNASVAASSNAGFVSGYAQGGSFTSISTAVPAFSSPSLTITPIKVKYPTYEEWSLAFEHQINRSTAISVNYVGNHGYQEPYQSQFPNASGFGSYLPATTPNPNFSQVTQVANGASSNYNGGYVSVVHQSKSLTLQANYTYSHALDEISNGGFNGFSGNSVYQQVPGNLAANYGNADYDTRQYVNGSYIYTIPHFGGPRELVDNWQFAGTVFHSSGLPFTPASPAAEGGTGNEYPWAAGYISKGQNHCGGTNHVFNRATGAAVGTCAFAADFSTPTDFGQTSRNQIFGPNYTDADLSILKGFTVPHWETGKLQVGVQMFNIFNHPNFAQPGSSCSPAIGTACNGASTFGVINGTVNPPTSILGSFLGGDASPRLIQLKASFVF